MYSTKQEAITEILEIEGTNKHFPIIFNKKEITLDQIIKTLSKESYTFGVELGISTTTSVSLVRKLWPNKPHTNVKICTWLFSLYDLKYCTNCNTVKETCFFSKNSSRPTGYNSHCKSCYLENTREYQREYQKTRKALVLKRVPMWADLDSIKQIYSNCPKGMHVDHVIPLQGKLVSGLHVENNLQYLTAEDNLKKYNKFQIL